MKNRTRTCVGILVGLVCLGVSPGTRAVIPAPDGDYPKENTAEGKNALLNLQITNVSSPGGNTAVGFEALKSDTTGAGNTAVGDSALNSNTTANLNTAVGWWALQSDITGSDNTAVGGGALTNDDAGSENTAVGTATLSQNKGGGRNTAVGKWALFRNVSGSSNTAFGYQALNALSGGSSNIAIGTFSGLNLTAGNNNIYIGSKGMASESNTIRIGTNFRTGTNTYIAGIWGAAVAGGVGVIVDSNGHLGTVVSSARFKDNIKPMEKASEAILKLEPVTFRYKQDLDPDGVPQFGLVAEQVEKANPDLVVRDEEGKPYTVRYDAVNAMLLNEFLKEHRTVQEQGATIAQMKKQIEALSDVVQRVSAQIETSKSAPQMAANDR